MGHGIKDISLTQIKEYSLHLAHKVSNSGWMPDHILYVERAGLFVGYVISRYFDCSISGIYCGRSGTSLKSKVKIILRLLPRAVTHLLREIEIKSNIHSIKEERKVYIDSMYPPKGKNLLVVDDAIDTGYSIEAVWDHLMQKGYDKDRVKIAVLTTTQPDIKRSADISLYKETVFAFPWSYDSKEYEKAWEKYEETRNLIHS